MELVHGWKKIMKEEGRSEECIVCMCYVEERNEWKECVECLRRLRFECHPFLVRGDYRGLDVSPNDFGSCEYSARWVRLTEVFTRSSLRSREIGLRLLWKTARIALFCETVAVALKRNMIHGQLKITKAAATSSSVAGPATHRREKMEVFNAEQPVRIKKTSLKASCEDALEISTKAAKPDSLEEHEGLRPGIPVRFNKNLWVVKELSADGLIEIESPISRRTKKVNRKLLKMNWYGEGKDDTKIKDVT
ncbi:hypothetical protein LR48_Vigan03g139000 [Vigna angularis]|uniref:Uncharacterized protein n=1 Tax=Phaseolus angularis TaxID=3914 RepID=A0A0L9U5A6_PHAAN|nr:hypothetical protein LR48_Vigan03g139000 [Vigna angularis]